MAKTDLNSIKNWFKTGLKPTQEQFWNWMDSFWHKDEKIPTSAVEGLEDALNGKASTAALSTKVDKVEGKSLLSDAEIERLEGLENQDLSLKADLVAGEVPLEQLPEEVFNVIEFYNLAAFPAVGKYATIYISNESNTTYRWNGFNYTAIGSSLALGETSTTAYRGDRGKIAYDKAVEIINSGIEFFANAVLKLRISWFNGYTIALRDAIVSPQEGMLIYVNEAPKGFQKYENGAWIPIGSNMANADQTLIANRTHNLNGKTLSFTGGKVKVPALTFETVITPDPVVDKIWYDGLKLWLTNKLGINKAILLDGDIVDASETQKGLVNLLTQIFKGDKTFKGKVRIESPVSTDTPYAFEVYNSNGDVLFRVNSSRNVEMGNFLFSSLNNILAFSGTRVFERSGISNIYGDSASAILGLRSTNLNFTMRDGKARLGGVLGGATDSTALFELDSTSGGFLLPRMTQAQRLALVYLGGAPPAIGLQVYQTDGVSGVYIHKSTGWVFAY